MASCAKLSARSTLETLRSGELTEAQARSLFQQGEEAVVFALLEMSKRLAEAQEKNGSWATPSTPSGMVPVYEKPPAKRRGKKRPGGKRGHPGSRRPSPERVDWQVEHRADCCPDCGSRLKRLAETRVRYTEDIPDVQPETTEHTIHRDWCPQCRKKVEPPVTAALPGCLLGNRVLALSAWLHYALGNTLSQIVEVFNFHLQFKITPGGLVQMWQRLQELLYGWYEQIQQEALDSAVLHGDETGWRNDGQTNWLWSFGNQHLTYYLIDRSRGSPALAKFFIQEFAGTLVTDFWAPTTRSRARRGKRAWSICCASWNRRSSTSRRARIGRPSPRSCGDWWGTRSGCGGGSRSCPSRHTLPAGTASTGGWPSSSTGRGKTPTPDAW